MNTLLHKNLKYFLAFSLLIISYWFLSTLKVDAAACPKNGTKLDWAPDSNGNRCPTAPDLYEIRLYKIYVCKELPTGITTSSTMNKDETCELFYDAGANGELIQISLGDTTTLKGKIIRPPNGSYASTMLIIDNYTSANSIFEFTGNVQGKAGLDGTGDSATGPWCATLPNIGVFSSTGNTSVGITCAADKATLTDAGLPGRYQETLQTLSNGSFDPDRDYTTAFGYLIDTNEFLASDGADVDKFMIVENERTSDLYTFTDETYAADISFFVSEGMIVGSNFGDAKTWLGGGPFAGKLTLKTRPLRGSWR